MEQEKIERVLAWVFIVLTFLAGVTVGSGVIGTITIALLLLSPK